MSAIPIQPHGGTLVNRLLEGTEFQEAKQRANSLKKIPIGNREISDLELIAIGGFSPLTGFMSKEDYTEVVEDMHLANGVAWSIPITLSVTKEQASSLKEGEEIALTNGTGTPIAIMELTEKFSHTKQKEAQAVYATSSQDHPGVAYLHQMGDVLLGGPIQLIQRPIYTDFPEFRLDPSQTRKIFQERGWRRVVGFQTRNPIHRAHEYIQKCALEVVDGLLVHPLVGETKSDDIPASIRMKCYNALLNNYYPKDRTILSVLPAAMRYAGPREAIFHAIVRKNYGCTHFIVGRDHAGVGNFYGTFDAHHIFDRFKKEELGITPLFFDHTFYCKHCGGMASIKTCPHDKNEHVSLSGTKVREMLRNGIIPPEEFTRQEVAQILIDAMATQK